MRAGAGKPLLGVLNRRRQQFRKGRRAEIAVHRLPGRRLAGHGHRMRPGDWHQRQPLLAVVIRFRPGRRHSAAVDVGHHAAGGIIG